MKRTSEWTRNLANQLLGKQGHDYNNGDILLAFLRHVESLQITPQHIQGKVLVIGQGTAFPERVFLTTPQSQFEELRKEVRAVYCCDPDDYPFPPNSYLKAPSVDTIDITSLPEPPAQTVYFESSNCEVFLPKVAVDFFDGILMMRIANIGTQIGEYGLIDTLIPYIKPGGHLICSGGEFPEHIPNNFFRPLSVVLLTRLSDFMDGHIFSENNGVVLRKR
jgi:hypothetical protein